MVKQRKIIIALLLSLLMAITATASAQPADISGHWAEAQIQSWLDEGLASGYPDGTFKPNREVSRAEFVAMVNRAFGIESEGALSGFADVKEGQWFYADVMAAKAKGYFGGYPDGTFKPQNSISRQEAASSLARLLNLDQTTQVLEQFEDSAQIPQWSRGSVGALVENGLMGGYPDNTFKPTRSITRAEAVATLDRARNIEKRLFDKAGTYGPAAGTKTIRGNVTISAAGVTLRNTVITGDLLLAESIGDGDVTLKNVTVKGTTTVAGGGSNSVQLIDCQIPEIKVTKDGVRVVASGNTSIKVTVLESGAILVEVETTGPGFETVIVSETIPPGSKISLSGNFESVEVGANVEIDAPEGEIKKLTLNAPAKVTGKAVIKEATINAEGASIEQKPEKTNVAEGVSAEVGGETVKGSASSGGGGGGGGGGTGGGGTADDPPIITAISGATLDGKTIIIGDNPPDPSTVTVTVSEDCNMKMLMNSDEVAAWELSDGVNNLTFAGSVTGITLTKVFEVMLEEDIDIGELLTVVDVATVLETAKSSGYRDDFYGETLGNLFDVIDKRITNSESLSNIYGSIDLPAIYSVADDNSKDKLEVAMGAAIKTYDNSLSLTEFLNESYNERLASITENTSLREEFFEAISFTELYEAITTCSNKEAVYNAINETKLVHALVENSDKDTLTQCALVLYTSVVNSSDNSIMTDMLGSIHLHSLLDVFSQHGTKIDIVLTDTKNKETTYTVQNN